jgi:hypothetical protein
MHGETVKKSESLLISSKDGANKCYIIHIVQIRTINTSTNKCTIKTQLISSIKHVHVSAPGVPSSGKF